MTEPRSNPLKLDVEVTDFASQLSSSSRFVDFIGSKRKRSCWSAAKKALYDCFVQGAGSKARHEQWWPRIDVSRGLKNKLSSDSDRVTMNPNVVFVLPFKLLIRWIARTSTVEHGSLT